MGSLVLIAGLAVPAAGQPADDVRARGMGLAAAGDSARAYELLAPWVESHSEDVEARSALAAVAARMGRLDEAEELVRELPGNDPRLALLGADVALERGEPRVAIQRLEPHWPGRPPALEREFKRILGRAYVESGQPAKALAILEAGAGDPELVLSRSRALFQSGRMEEAVLELAPFAERIRELGPENAPAAQRFLVGEVLIDYARALVATGRAEEAVSALEPNVVALGTRRGWDMLAQALVAAGRGDEARSALSRGAGLTRKP